MADHHEKLRGIDVDRDRVEIFVAQQATKLKKPFLAICRGHQVLNVALRGHHVGRSCQPISPMPSNMISLG